MAGQKGAEKKSREKCHKEKIYREKIAAKILHGLHNFFFIRQGIFNKKSELQTNSNSTIDAINRLLEATLQIKFRLHSLHTIEVLLGGQL